MSFKDCLHFDPAELAASDTIGSYIIGAGDEVIEAQTIAGSDWLQTVSVTAGSDGTLITQTGGALDVNVSSGTVTIQDGGNSITVDASDLDIRDLSASQDNVAISDGTDTMAVNADGSINISDNGGSLTVDATDLDIRDLDHASDSVRLGDGTTLYTGTTVASDHGLDVFVINADLDVNLQAGDGTDITQTGGALDVNIASGSISIGSDHVEDAAHSSGDTGSFVMGIRVDDLTSVPGTALAGTELDYQGLISAADGALFTASRTLDGSGNAIGSTSGSLDVNVTNSIDVDDGLADTAIASTATSVDTTVGGTNLIGSALANRKYLLVQNLGSQRMFVGGSGVTAANGIQLSKGSLLELRAGPSLDFYAITSTGTADARMMELS